MKIIRADLINFDSILDANFIFWTSEFIYSFNNQHIRTRMHLPVKENVLQLQYNKKTSILYIVCLAAQDIRGRLVLETAILWHLKDLMQAYQQFFIYNADSKPFKF